MKFMLMTLLISGSAFAYTNSPAGNDRVKDPTWSTNETRDPASLEVKTPKREKEPQKKANEPKQ
jgi:hypothetical protein